jgi:uncharacterized membrane protein YdcZ (DUF606 family)
MKKGRLTLWIISGGLVIAIILCVLAGWWGASEGAYELAKYLGLALVGIGTKLIESEEKGNSTPS